MWHPLKACVLWSKGWKKSGGPAVQKQEGPYTDRWVSTALHDLREHCDKHAQRTREAPDLTQGKQGLNWSLKTSISQLRKRLRKGASAQREPEYPWPQISWRGSASGLVSLEHRVWAAVTWDSFCWVCSSWWLSHRAFLQSKVNRYQGLVPLHCLPFKIQHWETSSPQAAFVYKTFLISYFSGGFNFKNGKQLFKILAKNTVHIYIWGKNKKKTHMKQKTHKQKTNI